jgi:predicted SAM-dependent methyltransferase
MGAVPGVFMKVNLGSGVHPWPGFVNVDLNGEADINAPVGKLPFEDGEVEELHAIHLFEHLHRRDVVFILSEWKRVLKRGGKLVLELPSLDKIVGMLAAGETDRRLTVMGLYGDPNDTKPDMLHKWGWSDKEITDVLTNAGFHDVKVMVPVFHIPKRDMRIEALTT